MSEHNMTGQEYITTQMRLIEAAKIVDDLDLDAFLKCISNAEAMAPLVDPTLFRKAADNMLAIKRLAEAGVKLRAAYGETYKAVMTTAVSKYLSEGEL